MNERLIAITLATSLALGASGCAVLGAEPKPKAPAASTTPSDSNSAPSQEAHLRKRFVPKVVSPGVVAGAQAYFDYPGVTPDKVADMEYCGNRSDKVLLTFDDYGSPDHIRAIAKVLQNNSVGAIFFPQFGKVKQPMFDELRQDGFWVGNHTADHPHLETLSDTDMQAAIKSGGQADLFRPPFGGTISKNGEVYFAGSRIIDQTKAVGKRICLWTVDTRDWTGKSAADIQETAIDKVRQGSVILMHQRDEYNTLDALPGIIDGIRAKGYEFCPLPDTPTTRQIPKTLPC